jgi:hypothetical protein
MKKFAIEIAIVTLLSGELSTAARAADQTVPGQGNANAARLALSSALVQSARQFIAGRIDQIRGHKLAKNVHEQDRNVCIRHRAGETAASKQAIIDALPPRVRPPGTRRVAGDRGGHRQVG